jgi:outer membrane biosynthesis protein TonB
MSWRGSAWESLGAGLVLVAAAVLAAGCHKTVKAEFERPPASASVPETPPDDGTEEPEVETAATASEPADAAPPVEDDPPAPKRITGRRPAPRPEPPPEPPPAPEPHLPLDESSAATPTIQDKLARTDDLLLTLRNRSLNDEQRQQVEAARVFAAQARKALEEGDFVRAAVLGDKGFILAEDVERSSQ